MRKNQFDELRNLIVNNNDVVVKRLDSLENRITALENPVSEQKTSSKKKSTTSATKKSSKKTSAPKAQTSKKSEIPVLTEAQLSNWAYYKACRSSYCYKQQGCKVWKGKVTKPEGFVFNADQWAKDKAEFEKVNKYIKKADR